MLGLYVLLFVTKGHPTWESIIDTFTMQAVQPCADDILNADMKLLDYTK